MNTAGEATRFFSQIFPSPFRGEITLAWARPQPDNNGKVEHRHFSQERHNDIESLINKAAELDNQGYDVWFTPCPRIPGTTGRTKDTSTDSVVVWADCDKGLDADGLEFVEQHDGIIVESGSLWVDESTGEVRPRVHVYFTVGPTDPSLLEDVNKQLGKYLGADSKWSSESLLRVPGTHNHKNSSATPVKVSRFAENTVPVQLHFTATTTADRVSSWQGELQAIRGRLPQHIQQRVTEQPIQGKRSTQRVELIMNAVEWGYTDGQIMWLLERHLPTQEKYGSRHVSYSMEDIHHHRQLHPHTGNKCADVRCAASPDWMKKEKSSENPVPTSETVSRVLAMSPQVKAKKDRCARVERFRTDYVHRVALAKLRGTIASISVQDYFELFTLATQGHSCAQDAYKATQALKGAQSAEMAAQAVLTLSWPDDVIAPCTGAVCGELTDALELVVRDLIEEEFFVHTADTGIYLVPRTGHLAGRARWELSPHNENVRNWISQAVHHRGFSLGRSGITKTVMDGAISLLAGIATEDASVDPPQLAIRTTAYDGGYLVDLGDTSGKFVHVTANGWSLVDWEEKMPVFATTTVPLPMPRTGGDREDFRRHLGFEEGSDAWHICWSWAVTSYMSDVQRPLLAFTGPAGAGKTGRTLAMASITDPLKEDSEPGPLQENDKDFATFMRSTHIPVAGNLDKMSPVMSNRLCQMTTGAQLTVRKLWTDGEPYTVTYMRTAIVNGINLIGLKDDALDRILAVELTKEMSDKDMVNLAQDRKENAGKWLGALFDDLVDILARVHTVSVDPRERFGMVARAAKVLGEEFYISRCAVVAEERAQRAENDETVLKMAGVIFRHLRNDNTTELTLSDMYETYQDIADEERQRTGRISDWIPKSALAVGHLLKRTGGALEKMGITYERLPRTAKRRAIRFVYDSESAEVEVRTTDNSANFLM